MNTEEHPVRRERSRETQQGPLSSRTGGEKAEKMGSTMSTGLYPVVSFEEVLYSESENSIWVHDGEEELDSHVDLDLKFSERDREKLEEGIRNQAILQLVGEVTGEVYLNAYLDEMEKTLESFSKRWGVALPEDKS